MVLLAAFGLTRAWSSLEWHSGADSSGDMNTQRNPSLTLVVASLTGLACATAAYAQPQPAASAAPLDAAKSPELTLHERLDFLETRLGEAGRRDKLYWTSWMVAYRVLTVVQGGASLWANSFYANAAEAKQFRVGMLTDTVTTAIGLVALGASYPTSIGARERVLALREGTVDGDRRALDRAETLLKTSAEETEFDVSWPMHVGNFALNAAAGLVIWLYGYPWDALIDGATGFAIGEIQIFTQPTQVVDDWREYRRNNGPPSNGAATQRAVKPTWTLVAHPGGVGLIVNF